MVTTIERGDGHLDDHRCADLTLGLLDDAEREAAFAHLAGCPACEARLRSHAGAAARARADLAARAAPAATVTPLPRPARARRALVPALAIAATLVAVALLPRALQHPAPAVSGAWLPAPGELVRLREGTTVDPRLAAGLEAYERHDLATAERELAAARTGGPAESLRRLYLAHARLAHGDAHQAVALLRGVDWRLVPEPWRREGALLFARALRADGRPAAADSLEHALRVTDPSTPVLP
jgi:hypothetical protein